jgi:hypothetical protein
MPTTQTQQIEEPTVRLSRRHNIKVHSDMETTFYSDLNESETMRTIETNRFRVEFLANTCKHLKLGWLLTEAEVSDNGHLTIKQSCRYGQGDVQKHGSQQVIEWINEDRRHMADIIASYMGLAATPRIFNAEVRVVHKQSSAVLGQDSLCSCIYDSYEAFCCGGGYASDMVAVVVEQAREAIHDMQL